MALIRYRTRSNAAPNGKPSIYLSGHPEEMPVWAVSLVEEILSNCDCAVYYYDDPEVVVDETYLSNLEQFQLLVIPVTRRLLQEGCRTLDTDLPFALKHRISILPVLMEKDILDMYVATFGTIQFLDRNQYDETAISYADKLSAFLRAVTMDDGQLELIRKSFESYIFLSYRKKDRRYAQELMRRIHDTDGFSDVAIWYDEFLPPGEDFGQIIDEALKNAPVFALAVTPNLLEEGNYVMAHEYPAALQRGKPILAAQMAETDREEMAKYYLKIPRFTDPRDPEHLRQTLVNNFRGIPLGENKDDPHHLFYMGIAYLNGIDVEVDRARAVEYIEKAAYMGLWQAAQKLADLYTHGQSVDRDPINAKAWRFRLHQLLLLKMKEFPEDPALINHYLDNLHAACGDHHSASAWARDALKNLLDTARYLIPADRLAECLLLARQLRVYEKDDAHSAIKKLCRAKPSSQNLLVLAQAYLECGSGNQLGFYKKALRICKDICKDNRNTQALFCYTQAAFFLLKASRRQGKKYVSQYQQLLQNCKQLTENAINLPATRLMAEICEWMPDSRMEYSEQEMLQQEQLLHWLKNRAQQAYSYTGLWIDKHYLECTLTKLSIWDQGKHADLYGCLAENLRNIETVNNSNELSFDVQGILLYQQYLNMAEKAAQLTDGLDQKSWDHGIRELSPRQDLPQTEILVLERKLRCNSYMDAPQLQSLAQEASEIWDNYAIANAAVLRANILLRQIKASECNADDYADGLYTALECISFESRLQIWIDRAFTVPPREDFWTEFFVEAFAYLQKKDWVSDALKELWGCTHDYFYALKYLHSGDLGKARDYIRWPARSKDPRIIAAVNELMPRFHQLNPKSALRSYLGVANDARGKLRNCGHLPACHVLSIAMNCCDLAALEDPEEACTLMEAAGSYCNLGWRYTSQSLDILLRISKQCTKLLWETAPETCKAISNRASNILQEQMRVNPNPMIIPLLLDNIDFLHHIEFDDIVLFIRFSKEKPQEATRRLVSVLAYRYLCQSVENRLPEPHYVLQIQRQLLAENDTLENRRHLAKSLVQLGTMLEIPGSALGGDAQKRYTNRLLHAQQLMAEVEVLWSEDDRVIANDIIIRLQKQESTQAKLLDKDRVQGQYDKDHGVSAEQCRKSYLLLIGLLRDNIGLSRANDLLENLISSAEQMLRINAPICEQAQVYVEIHDLMKLIASSPVKEQLQQIQAKFAESLKNWLRTATVEAYRNIPHTGILNQAVSLAGLKESLLVLLENWTINEKSCDCRLELSRLAENYFELQAYDKAKEIWLKLAEEISREQQPESCINFYENIGHRFLEAGRLREAQPYFRQGFCCRRQQLVKATLAETVAAAREYTEIICNLLGLYPNYTEQQLRAMLGSEITVFEEFLIPKDKGEYWKKELVSTYARTYRICAVKYCIRICKRYYKGSIDSYLLRMDLRRAKEEQRKRKKK